MTATAVGGTDTLELSKSLYFNHLGLLQKRVLLRRGFLSGHFSKSLTQKGLRLFFCALPVGDKPIVTRFVAFPPLPQSGSAQHYREAVTLPSLEQARTHNAVNETTLIGLQSMGAGTDWADPAYDANGNMTSFPSPSAPSASLTATYDAWNRLVKLADTGGTFAEYEYDGLNRRITKTVSSTVRHYYFSDLWQVLEERVDSATSADRQYVWGLRYVDDLVLRDRTSERLYSLQDALFNVVALTDDTGNVKERFAYQPYGQSKPLNPDFTTYSGTDYQWEYRFTGRELDLESGLQLNRNRYLHLELGRWLSRDPIGYEGSEWNLYEYVSGTPIDYIDPTGLVESPNGCWTWVGTSAGGQVLFGYYRTKANFYGNESLLIGYRVYTCPNQVFKQPIYRVPKATGVIRTFPIGLGLGGTGYRWAAGRVCEAPDSSDIKGGDWSYVTCGATAFVAGFNFGGGSGNTEGEAGLDFGLGFSLSTTPSYTSIWTEGYEIYEGPIAPGFRKTLKNCKVSIEGVDPPKVVPTPPGVIELPK